MAKIDFKLIEYYCNAIEERYEKNLKAIKKTKNRKLIAAFEREKTEADVWFCRYKILVEYLRKNPKADINKLRKEDLDDLSTISWLSWFKGNAFKYKVSFYKFHLLALIGVQLKDEKGKIIDYVIPEVQSHRKKILSIFRKG